MRTERLYYRDPYQRTFEARVTACHERISMRDGRPAVSLDVTAFYPTSGGQPHDVGVLNDTNVVEVLIDEQGDLLHILDRPSDSLREGAPVHGEIDWERRFDHMQQHTGQHVLSHAFAQVCTANRRTDNRQASARCATVGFHLGEQLSTIDLDRAPLEPDIIHQADGPGLADR